MVSENSLPSGGPCPPYGGCDRPINAGIFFLRNHLGNLSTIDRRRALGMLLLIADLIRLIIKWLNVDEGAGGAIFLV